MLIINYLRMQKGITKKKVSLWEGNKRLIVVRHAKSDWPAGIDDYDRPLDATGSKEAAAMAALLSGFRLKIDVLVSSTANRAYSTAKHFLAAYPQAPLIGQKDLYHAEPETIGDVVSLIDADYVTAAVFSHNPGVTDFVNGLCDIKVQSMPTCGVYAVVFRADDWAGFRAAEKKFLFFEKP